MSRSKFIVGWNVQTWDNSPLNSALFVGSRQFKFLVFQKDILERVPITEINRTNPNYDRGHCYPIHHYLPFSRDWRIFSIWLLWPFCVKLTFRGKLYQWGVQYEA